MATIKEILQNFCYRVNIPAPTSFVGVSKPSERQLLSLFQFIGDNLRNRPYQWPQLKRGYTFNTVTDESIIQLPGDFYRLLDSTQWDTTNQWPLAGPISDARFTQRQFAIIGLTNRKAYRIIGPTQHLFATSPYSQRSAGTIQIDPPGENDTDELFLGYLSCNWIWPRDWVTATVYAGGSIRSGDGFVYRTAAGGTSGANRPTGETSPQNDGSPGVAWSVYREPYLYTPGNAALNDDDLCLFDEDLMIEGMRWAWFRGKKQDYQQERADWEDMVRNAYARFEGPDRINMCGDHADFEDWPRTPPGDWNI